MSLAHGDRAGRGGGWWQVSAGRVSFVVLTVLLATLLGAQPVQAAVSVPSAPRGLIARAGVNSAGLSWVAPLRNGGARWIAIEWLGRRAQGARGRC